MISFPNAKINLGLNILSKRSDGYHHLSSCFYPVGWKDMLEIIPSNNLHFTSSGITIPGNSSDNLCIRAYNLLKNHFQLPSVHIHLHKIIPIGAGLGGGSADAACVLKMLNEMFSLALSIQQLEKYATKLGSDCAFFIQNKPVLVSGTGTEFSPTSLDLSNNKIIIIHPNIHISTKEAYSGIVPNKNNNPIHEVLKKPLSLWTPILVNDFESSIAIKHPNISRLKKEFYNTGALYASMSGSGSSVFAIYDNSYDLSTLTNKFDSYTSWSGLLN